MEDFALVHRDDGLMSRFPTVVEAAQEMARVVVEEPDRIYDLWIERVAPDATADDAG